MLKTSAMAVLAGAVLAGCAAMAPTAGRLHPVTPPALARWEVHGIGQKELVDGASAVMLTEGEDSQGVVLLSPRQYGPNLVVTFRAKPMQHEGVCVAMLNVSPVKGRRLPLPEDYDGAIGVWRDEEPGIRNYFFAFHTAYHQPNAFVQRNPGALDLARVPDQVTEQRWHEIELGSVEGRVWMRVDGEMVFDARDPDGPLPAGHVALRLRGPGDGSFSTLFKDMVIEEMP